MARKIILSRRDWVREPGVVFSGGSWTSLENVAEMRPQVVAEAIDTDDSSTKFRVDLLFPRLIGLLFFANLRATTAGTLRVWASLDGVNPVYDSSTVGCWPADVTAGQPNPWGVVSPTGSYNAQFYEALGFPRVLVPDTIFSARYVDVEITDTDALSLLQIGRFGACEVWSPPETFRYGWTVSGIDESEIQGVPGGSTYVRERGVRRRMSFGFPALPEDEFLARELDWTLVQGRRAPLIVVPFPDNGGNIEKTAIYGLVSRDSEMSNPFVGYYAQTFQVDQLI